MEYRYQAIVLEKRDVGEADRLYTFFTREAGKVICVARGVRRSQARLASQLENFSSVDLFLARSRGGGSITGAIVEESYPTIRTRFEWVSQLLDDAALTARVTEAGEIEEKIYDLLQTLFRIAECYAEKKYVPERWDVLQLGFRFKLFAILGYQLETRTCVLCGEKLVSPRGMCFIASHGGVACEQCCRNGSGDEQAVSENVVKLLRIFYANDLSSMGKIRATRSDIAGVRKVFNAFYHWVT